MSALPLIISEEYTQRYEALLRATNAIGTCTDCDSASDMVVKTLLEVIPFDYLQIVWFESDTKTIAWHLLYANGIRQHRCLEDLVLDGTPMQWVHESQEILITTDWRKE